MDAGWRLVHCLLQLHNTGGNATSGIGSDVLIRGSWPPPFLLRFCIRDVDENGDVVAGILCWRHCAGRCKEEGMRFVVVKGRKTGRKDERFMVVCGAAQVWVVTIG
jgi:hypothetical protein